MPTAQTTLEEDLAELDGDVTPTLTPPVDEEIEEKVGTLQALLEEYRDPRLSKAVDPELNRVIEEIEAIAYSNIADLYECKTIWEQCGLDEDGEPQYQLIDRISLKDFTKLPRSVTACIQSVKIKADRGGDVVELKFYDKLAALEKLMRFRGGYAVENEQKATAGSALIDALFSSAENTGMPTPVSDVP